MKRNLVLYADYKEEDKKYAEVIGRIIGNCKVRPTDSRDINISNIIM